VRYYLEITALTNSSESTEVLCKILDTARYQTQYHETLESFLAAIQQNQQEIDCLIIQEDPLLEQTIEQLSTANIILPAVIWCSRSQNLPKKPWIYHAAEVIASEQDLEIFRRSIDRAINNFLYLTPISSNLGQTNVAPASAVPSNAVNLLEQQKRLTDKLKERLGYLGVYYKREPKLFLRNLPAEDRHALLQELRSEYREIVLAYFAEDGTVNMRVDRFVEQAFFADMSVSQIVEIHMELMDALATQLKLEGRSEEILLDYRLTLIDIIAHLCEMYRRSIPRE